MARIRPAAWLVLVTAHALLCSPAARLCAQSPLDTKTPALPDPVKGFGDPSPLTPDERELLRTQRPPHTPLPALRPANRAATATGRVLDDVLFDDTGDGIVLAVGNTWKGSFGADAFTFVPFCGSAAPRDFPVRFTLRDVRIGGRSLPLTAERVTRDGDVVHVPRGAVLERYALALDHVEQTFVVDSELVGDVDVVLAVDSELAAHAGQPCIEFANAWGRVGYGQAHVVLGAEMLPVPTTFAGGQIVIHVPQALRTNAPLVIDPLINNQTVASFGPNDMSQPDIAYDATSNQYLVVWQYQFSAADADVYSEFCNATGALQSATLAAIDVSTFSHNNPRVANLNVGDRFLVVSQRYESPRWQIWGRLRLAGQQPHAIVFRISDPNFAGDAVNPDIGGDSADVGACDNWLVVWQRDLSATDSDIHGRLVRIDTTLVSSTLLLANTTGTVHSLPSVSQSNGNGFTSTPRWMVVFQFRFSATDWDVYGCTVSQNGTITTSITAIDLSTANDLVPSVASPNTDSAGGNPLFLVTYERQSPAAARARLLSATLINQVPAVDLTAAFGIGPFWVRTECDGNRFAIVHGASTINVSAIGYNGTALVQQDQPWFLYGVPAYPRICSKRSGGGTHTNYGVAYVDTLLTPDRISVATYDGHSGGLGIIPRNIGCAALGFSATGAPNLGDSMTFSMSTYGTDVPLFALGEPIIPNYTVCGFCALGVNPSTAILVPGDTIVITVPPSLSLLGFNGAVQSMALGSGPCVATLRFGNGAEFTVR